LEILNERYVPSWRRKKKRPAKIWSRSLLAALSVCCAVFLLLPPQAGYDTPISLLVAGGNVLGWLCMGTMGATSAYFSARLWRKREVASALGSTLICGGLVFIALTNPYSANHNFAFVAVALFIVTWHWFFYSLETGLIYFLTALAVTFGLFACFHSLGIGERVLALGSLVTVNVIFFDYLDD